MKGYAFDFYKVTKISGPVQTVAETIFPAARTFRGYPYSSRSFSFRPLSFAAVAGKSRIGLALRLDGAFETSLAEHGRDARRCVVCGPMLGR